MWLDMLSSIAKVEMSYRYLSVVVVVITKNRHVYEWGSGEHTSTYKEKRLHVTKKKNIFRRLTRKC